MLNTIDSNTLSNVDTQNAAIQNQISEAEIQKWEKLGSEIDNASKGHIGIEALLALFAEIIRNNQELRASFTAERINSIAMNNKLAISLSDMKAANSVEKFITSTVSSVFGMAISTGSAIRMGQQKLVQDKHLSPNADGTSRKVSDLTQKQMDKLSTSLQDTRTQKYSHISRLGDTAGKITDSVNQIDYANDVSKEDEVSATKSMQEQHLQLLEQSINTMTQEVVKLTEILAAIARAGATTNR